jgi:hypothetical protein
VVPIPPSPLTLVERNTLLVLLGPLVEINNHAGSTHVVLWPWRWREVWRKRGSGGRGVPDARRRRRADELEPASPSFFVFFSHNNIFIARLWRQRCSMRVAMEARVMCVWHRRLKVRLKKTLADHCSCRLAPSPSMPAAPSRQSAPVLIALRATSVGQCKRHAASIPFGLLPCRHVQYVGGHARCPPAST